MRISSQQKSVWRLLMVVEIIGWCSAAVGADHTVTYPKLVPEIMWCRGCTPTSAAMAMGYWDNYNESRTYLGMGRLIDYWRDLSKKSDDTGTLINVPNILDELRVAMGTTVGGVTSSNNIGPGIRSVANTTNRYSFGSGQCSGWWLNDYCWGTIKDEINNNRPFVWSVGLSDQVGHSLCAWGYTDSKYVIVYNTWNYGRDDWYYTKYDNGPNTDWQYVDTVVPGGWQDDNQLVLDDPEEGKSSMVGKPLRSGGTIGGPLSITLTFTIQPMLERPGFLLLHG